MTGKTTARDVTIKHCDANTAINFNIIQPGSDIIKSATLLLNTEMKWYSVTGRIEIFEAVGFYAALIMESEAFVCVNTIFQIDCFKIIKGEMVAYKEGQNYLRRKGTFKKIRIDKFGFVSFIEKK